MTSTQVLKSMSNTRNFAKSEFPFFVDFTHYLLIENKNLKGPNPKMVLTNEMSI